MGGWRVDANASACLRLLAEGPADGMGGRGARAHSLTNGRGRCTTNVVGYLRIVQRFDPLHGVSLSVRPCPSVSLDRVDVPSVATTSSAQRVEARNAIGWAGSGGRSHEDRIQFSEQKRGRIE